MKLGRYRIVDRIAVGGMAELFLGNLEGAKGFEKKVAIKQILPQWSQDPDFVAMLVDEAKIVVQLNHPNIVQVIELGREAETYFIAMEYIDGIDLRGLLHQKNGPLPREATFFIIHELLQGLSYAHAKGVIHRDISPQNILLSSEGQVKITDFGIAKAASRSRESHTGVLKGKFAYMSPEQASGSDLDTRSDLFSSGTLFYEMLTGKRLFEGKGDLDTLERIRSGKVVFAPHFDSDEESGIKKILERSLSVDPKDRFQTASEFKEALLGTLQEKGIRLGPEALVACLKGSDLIKGPKKNLLNDVTVSWRPKKKKIPVPIFLLLFGAVAGFIFLGYQKWRMPERATPSHTIESGPLGVPEKPVPSRTIESGSLSIQVIPWGQVIVDGKDSYESPLRQLSLSEGDHRLKISHGDAKGDFETKINIQPGVHLVCLSDVKKRALECH